MGHSAIIKLAVIREFNRLKRKNDMPNHEKTDELEQFVDYVNECAGDLLANNTKEQLEVKVRDQIGIIHKSVESGRSKFGHRDSSKLTMNENATKGDLVGMS